MSNLRYLVKAVEDRGVPVRRIDDYVFVINGKKFVYDQALAVMRKIIKKYRVRLDLQSHFQGGSL